MDTTGRFGCAWDSAVMFDKRFLSGPYCWDRQDCRGARRRLRRCADAALIGSLLILVRPLALVLSLLILILPLLVLLAWPRPLLS